MRWRRAHTELGPNIDLFVVSDVIAWCREQPVFQDAQIFVGLSDATTSPSEEFEVLRNCRNLVISNSTFAWLSDAPDKLVIAPEEWSKNSLFQCADRIPAT